MVNDRLRNKESQWRPNGVTARIWPPKAVVCTNKGTRGTSTTPRVGTCPESNMGMTSQDKRLFIQTLAHKLEFRRIPKFLYAAVILTECTIVPFPGDHLLAMSGAFTPTKMAVLTAFSGGNLDFAF